MALRNDFGNPLEPNSDDISLDVFDLQDPRAAIALKNQSFDEFTRRNVYKGVEIFQGLVISTPTEVDKPRGLVDIVYGSLGGGQTLRVFKIHIPSIHYPLGNPCDTDGLEKFGPVDTADAKATTIKKIINNHPWFYAKINNAVGGGSEIGAGDWVRVRFAKGPSGGKTIEGEIIEVIAKDIAPAIYKCDDSIAGAFNNPSSNPTRLGNPPTGPRSTPDPNGQGGAKPATDIEFAWPFPDYYRNSPVMEWREIEGSVGPHTGIDLGGSRFGYVVGTTPVYASADGTVLSISGAGNNRTVTVEHTDSQGQKFQTRYMHVSNPKVKRGDQVKRGQQIACYGSYPNPETKEESPHLHFEILAPLATGAFPSDAKRYFISSYNADTTPDKSVFRAEFQKSVLNPDKVVTLPCIPSTPTTSARALAAQ